MSQKAPCKTNSFPFDDSIPQKPEDLERENDLTLHVSTLLDAPSLTEEDVTEKTQGEALKGTCLTMTSPFNCCMAK